MISVSVQLAYLSTGIAPSWIEYAVMLLYLSVYLKTTVKLKLAVIIAVAAGCAVIRPWEAILIGAIGGMIVILSADLLERVGVDDPVGAVAVHGIGGTWVGGMWVGGM